MGEGPKVYFPLASNAHALLKGRPLEGVRRRLKVASLLHEEILLESGLLRIQAGANGAIALGTPDSTIEAEWQSPSERGTLQAGEFTVSIGRQGTDPTGDEGTTLRSNSAIAWNPTFEPFRREFPSGIDWIQLGRFAVPPKSQATDEVLSALRSRDESNLAITRKLPDPLVRNQVLRHVESDLTLAASFGTRVSIDRLHAEVLSSRFADPRIRSRGFALPFLIPRAGELSWSDIGELRRHKAIASLRRVLADIEEESLAQVKSRSELPNAVVNNYVSRLERYSRDLPSVGGSIGVGVAEMVLGGAIGFATAGIGWVGAAIGALPGVARTATGATLVYRKRRQRAWITALQAVSQK